MKPETRQVEVVLTSKNKINHNCYIFSFMFPAERIEFSIGQCFRLYAKIPTPHHPEGKVVRRKYTPINPCSQKDKIDVLVKIYRPHVHPLYPNGGLFTTYLENLEPGARLTMEGPKGKFGYKAGGIITIKGHQYPCRRLLMIAGGSGIAPIYQSMMEIVNMKDEKIDLIFLFANTTEEDILLRKQLEARQDRVKIHYILSHPPENWKHFKGRITHQILKGICPLDDPELVVISSGPKPFDHFLKNLFRNEYPDTVYFKF